MEPPIPNSTTNSPTKSPSLNSPFFTERARQLQRRPSPPPPSPSSNYIDYLHLDAVAGVAGAAVAYKAMKLWYSNLKFTFSALRKVRHAPTVAISDLGSFLNHVKDDEGRIVVIRGFVQPSPDWMSTLLGPRVVESVDVSGKVVRGVLSLRPFISAEGDKGWFRWVPSLMFVGQGADFVLADADRTPKLYTSSYVNVNVNLEDDPLLPFVYTRSRPIADSINPLKSGKFLFELMLPVGKEVTAVGRIFRGGKGGKPYIEACNDLPYYVSDLTKDQIVVDLINKKEFLILSGIVFGSLSIWVLARTFRRCWRKHKSSS